VVLGNDAIAVRSLVGAVASVSYSQGGTECSIEALCSLRSAPLATYYYCSLFGGSTRKLGELK